jgi:hypothetical protein
MVSLRPHNLLAALIGEVDFRLPLKNDMKRAGIVSFIDNSV